MKKITTGSLSMLLMLNSLLLPSVIAKAERTDLSKNKSTQVSGNVYGENTDLENSDEKPSSDTNGSDNDIQKGDQETEQDLSVYLIELDQLEGFITKSLKSTTTSVLASDKFASEFSKIEVRLANLSQKVTSMTPGGKAVAQLLEKVSATSKKADELATAIANARTEVKYQENLEIAKEKQAEEQAKKEQEAKDRKEKGVTKAGEVEVSTSKELAAAIKNKEVSKILITADIKIDSTMTRSAAVEIDGQNHTIDVNKIDFFSVNAPKGDVVKWSNVVFKNFSTTDTNFMTATPGTSTLHLHNVTAGSQTDAPRRFISSPRSKLIFSGINTIHARGELFMLGGAVVEDNTTLNLIETRHNWSVFWFSEVSAAGNTGDEKLLIGKNSNVSARMIQPQGDGDYPAIFYAVDTIDVGENSVLLAHSAKEAVRSDLRNMVFTIRKGALMNATSIGNYGRSIINQVAGSVTVRTEPTAEFYTIGKSGEAAIKAKEVTLDSPKRYDIRSSANTPVAVSQNTDLTIKNTDLSLWKQANKDFKGPADESYTVGNFHARGTSVQATDTSGKPLPVLADYAKKKFRRIAGFNSFPELTVDPLTDADKTAHARVKVGQTPGDDFDENGNIMWEDVYAGPDEVEVSIKDTFGDIKKAKTGNKDGYADVSLERFNIAYKDIMATGKATNGRETKQEKAKPVLDITPPQPAVVIVNDTEHTAKDTIEVGQNLTSLSGYLPDEFYDNAGTDKFTVKLMDGKQVVSTVEVPKSEIQDNKVPFEFTGLDLYQFPEGKQLQIIASDSAADGTILAQPDPSQAEIEAAEKEGRDPIMPEKIDAYSELKEKPVTRSKDGNTTPTTDVTYRDATFKAGTKVTVVEPQGSLELEVPDDVTFGEKEIKTGILKLKPKTVGGRLAVVDDRVVEKTNWSLQVREVQGLENQDNSLAGLLKYKYAKTELTINNEFNQIDSATLAADVDEKVYSTTWTDETTDEGLSLAIPFSKQKPGSYKGVLEWKLVEGPGDTIE